MLTVAQRQGWLQAFRLIWQDALTEILVLLLVGSKPRELEESLPGSRPQVGEIIIFEGELTYEQQVTIYLQGYEGADIRDLLQQAPDILQAARKPDTGGKAINILFQVAQQLEQVLLAGSSIWPLQHDVSRAIRRLSSI